MPPAPPDGAASTPRERRWAVILAGGDGTRLQKLTRLICRDNRPKQFCRLIGDDTLLEQTRMRAKRSIPVDQILFSLVRNHCSFYHEERGIRASQRIVQPVNKGTAPPILHGLLSIERLDPDAIVAILPCDHYYSDEQMFTAALEAACDAAAHRTSCVVLLGARPHGPEVEYGWIEIGAPACGGELFHVRRFCEKPSLQEARELLQRGCLWNTFVLVGHVGAFLEMIRAALPELVEEFRMSALWGGDELHIRESFYARFPALDFSHQVLSVQTRRLMALRLGRTEWNDLGHPERVITVLRKLGLDPFWLKEWHASKPPGVAAQYSSSSSPAGLARMDGTNGPLPGHPDLENELSANCGIQSV